MKRRQTTNVIALVLHNLHSYLCLQPLQAAAQALVCLFDLDVGSLRGELKNLRQNSTIM